MKTRPSHPRRRAPRLAPLALTLCLALAGAGAALAASDPKASRFYEDALVRYEKKDLPGAVIQLKNALQIDKNLLPVHVLLGKALLEQGEVAAAEAALEQALALGVNRAEVVVPLARAVVGQAKQPLLLEDPRFAEAGLAPGVRYELLLVKAGAATDTGKIDVAMKLIEAARAIDPGKPGSWVTEVTTRSRAGQLAEAQAAADKALSIQPALAEALYLRGTVSHVRGDLNAAMSYYDRALTAEPNYVEALVSRAGLLLDLKRAADAERDIAVLKEASPKDPRAAYMTALIAERAARPADARQALNEVTNLIDPVPIDYMRYRPQLLMLGGLSHYGLNQTEKARPYLEAVLRAQPGSPAAKLLAQILLKEKNPGPASEVLERYLRSNAGDAQAVMLLASAHMALGRHGRATTLLQSAVEQTDLPAFRSSLGLSLMGAGKPAAAVPELEAAFRRDPGQVQAGTALAALYLAQRQPAKAVAVADAMVKRQPGQPGLLYLQGTARLRAGDVKGARQALEKAAGLDDAFVAPLIELARLDISTRALDSAAARLDGVLAKDAQNVEALTTMGQLQQIRGQTEDARRWFEKADDHSAPGQLEPGLRLVAFDLGNGRVDLARESLKRLTGKAPEAVPVLIAQAQVQLAGRDAGGVRSSLARASALAAYDTPALVRIASLQMAAQDADGAAHSLGKALADQPNDLRAQLLMGRVELQRGNPAAAEPLARKVAAAHPKLGEGQRLLGDVALARGDKAAGVEAHRRAHQLDQTSASLLRLHQVLGVGDPAAAQQLALQWLKSHPKDAAVARAVADGHARAGELPAARDAYRALVKLTPDDAEALNNLANVLILLRDGGALAVAERALALKPQAAHIIGTAGWAAHQAGQSERALQLLRDARLRDPANAETRFFLGSVLASAGRKAEARQELRAALDAGRAFPSAQAAEKLLATLN